MNAVVLDKNLTVFHNKEDIFKYLVDVHKNCVCKENLNLKYYEYRNDIDKDVYIVTTDRYGDVNYIEKYGCPQYLCSVIMM